MELIVIAIVLALTGAQQSQLEGPQNTLSFVGSTVTLKCSSPSRNCNGTDWQKYVPGASPVTIFKGPGIILNVVDRDRYSVDNSSGCDLVIRNVQLTDAGRFICSAITSSSQTTKTAYLIILEDQPKCVIDAFENNTVDGDRMQLTCEVTYKGTDRASMIWKGVDDAPASVKNGKTIRRPYSAVTSVPEVPSFTCVTLFAIETDDEIGGLATNSIPNVICETPVIKILYSVRNVTLSPSLSNYPSGTIITCAARGHPSPTLKWQEIDNCGAWRDIHNQIGSQLPLSNVSSKRYRCVATNVVRDRSYNATSREIQFNNAEFNDDLSSTRPTCTCIVSGDSLGTGIGIGVGIGVLVTILLATVTVSILFRLRYLEFHRRSANKSPDMDQPMSPSFRQLLSMDQSTPGPTTEARLIGEQERAYASLGEDRDLAKYESLGER